ncbi:MAG: aminotransferase class V-fold PLP-dependent enzyme, partial [Ignavibacteriales bacterium]|nr:aminotransferase class V-fold PLP-dependent enzyme [Ignavibacteriales bacterium]
MENLRAVFDPFRKNIIGIDDEISTPFGKKKLLYADWIASGRMYKPIEAALCEKFGPYCANTHSESSYTGALMTNAYHHAQNIIKRHVNAGPDDVLLNAGSGMTGVVNKLIRILGLRVPEQLKDFTNVPGELKPVVFITHIEHHSNQTSWLETIADVVVLEAEPDGTVGTSSLENEIGKYKERKLKIGSFSACSNVTGIKTPYHKLAAIMHQNGGLCFIDFACSAPYILIDMHPANPEERLDAIFFSPHKFLGGPGAPGIMIFDSHLYKNRVPDNPGGGTVDWTNPWGGYKFVNNIEAREDGGTPPFLQTFKAALAINLKEDMGVANIIAQEERLVARFFSHLDTMPRVHVLADNLRDRLGAISLYIENVHYNLAVKLLNDFFGIQSRGGCSCAGTYGHYLLHVDPNRSKSITDKIDAGDLSEKPGWVRISLHPTMTEEEIDLIAEGLRAVVQNAEKWEKEYQYDAHRNEFFHKLDSDAG